MEVSCGQTGRNFRLKLNYNGGSRQVTTTTERVIDSLFIQWQKINP